MLRLRQIHQIISEDYRRATLDACLLSFDPRGAARVWTKARLRDVAPPLVAGMAVDEMVFMLTVAMEIEEPIQEYSRENGEGFRLLLPELGRFMGKNRDEAASAELLGLPWCESPWCAEERRHATTFARIVERLSGSAPPRANPNRPRVVTPRREDAIRLLLSREAAEWNSSSTYVVMAAHATGELHTLLRNVARDEIKHLAILSAVDLLLFGRGPWRRFTRLVRQSLNEFRGQRKVRTGGRRMGSNRRTAFEVVFAHLAAEWRVRRWMRTLDRARLSELFGREAAA